MTNTGKYRAPLWKREPAQLLGLAYSIATGVVAFLYTVLNEVGGDATWPEVALVAASVLIPLLQGRTTRESVYSPARYEQDLALTNGATDGP